MFIDQMAACYELTSPCSGHVVNGEKRSKLTTADDRVAAGQRRLTCTTKLGGGRFLVRE
jgi:hypothetical protein